MDVLCWGRGEDGQLGLDDAADQLLPKVVPGLPSNVSDIVCGSGHTVALCSSGEVFTWGRGDDGRLGHGDSLWRHKPVLVKFVKMVKQITCGSYHTAAVTYDGSLYTWGGGMYGKLGHGNENGFSTPRVVGTLRDLRVEQVACGSRHTVVLASSENPKTTNVYSWGDNTNGVTGLGEERGHQYVPEVIKELANKDVTEIAACGFHTAVVTKSGEVYTWGEGKFGRLGHGCDADECAPTRVKATISTEVICRVACGGFHTAAVSTSGQLFTWGGGEHGQLGHNTKENRQVPTRVEGLLAESVEQITCGWSHTVALTAKGLVYTWGNGDHGKLGHGHEDKVIVPKVVEALRGKEVYRIASYNEHTLALTCPKQIDTDDQVMSEFKMELGGLVDDATFADVIFVFEGQEIHAHRAILAARCDHFKAMFTSGMKESTEKRISITGIRYDTFKSLLNYLYTDTVGELSAEMAIELYIAADLYTLDHLKGQCETLVRKQINTENAAFLLKTVDELNESDLRAMCLLYVVDNFEIISKSASFGVLNRELILEVLQSR